MAADVVKLAAPSVASKYGLQHALLDVQTGLTPPGVNMQTFHRLFGVFLTCFAAAATLPGGLVVPVNAAILEEVIVTAQKREQQLSDVGISVTAFTGEQIKEFGLTDSVDLSSMTPGLQYTVPNAEGSQINFFIRGSGLNEAGDANENPVGVLVDDVYRGAIGGLHFPMFDMERTEVLRGPQGTLYGRNTTGGLIYFITNRPTEEFEGYGDISFARHDQVKFEGAISGLLNESKSLLGRVSGSVNQHDGYTENRFPGVDDYNEADAFAGRVQLLWRPREDLQILGIVHGAENDAQVGAWQHEPTVFDASGDDRFVLSPTVDAYGTCPGCDVFGYRDTDGDPHAGEYDRDGRVFVKTHGATAKINWDVAGVSITSITAYDHVERL